MKTKKAHSKTGIRVGKLKIGGKCLSVFVYQFHTPEDRETFPAEIHANQAVQVMDFIRSGRAGNIVTTQEIHVLRLLRLIREEVDGLRLSTASVRFYFDVPGKPGELMKIDPTEDGDLSARVPGGFFTARSVELF